MALERSPQTEDFSLFFIALCTTGYTVHLGGLNLKTIVFKCKSKKKRFLPFNMLLRNSIYCFSDTYLQLEILLSQKLQSLL